MTVLQCIALCIAYATASLIWVDNMQPPGGTNHFVWKGNCCFDVFVQTKVTEGSTALCYVTSDVSGKTEDYPMLLDEDLGNNIHQHFATLQVSNLQPGQYQYHAYCRDSSDGTLMKLAAGKPGILHISERHNQGSPKRQDPAPPGGDPNSPDPNSPPGPAPLDTTSDSNQPQGGDTNSPPPAPDMTSCDSDFSSSSEDQTSTSTSTSSSSTVTARTRGRSSSSSSYETSSEAPKTSGPGKTTSPPKTSAPRTSTSSSTSDQPDTTSSSSDDGDVSTSTSSSASTSRTTKTSRTQSSTSQVETSTSTSQVETSTSQDETSQSSQTSQTTSQKPSSTFQVESSTPVSTSTSTRPSATCDTFVPRTTCMDMVCLNGNFVGNSGDGFLIPSSGTKVVPDQIPSDSTKILTFIKRGITGTLIPSTYTNLKLQVDSGTNSGKGYNARVSYDFNGDSNWDRIELYKLFATNPIVDYETFAFVGSPTNTKVSINTVPLSDLNNGAVRLEVWQSLPSSTNGTLLVNGPVNSPTGVQETTLQIPYVSVSVSESATCQVTSSGDGRATADGTAGPDGRESTSDGFNLNFKLSVIAMVMAILAL